MTTYLDFYLSKPLWYVLSKAMDYWGEGGEGLPKTMYIFFPASSKKINRWGLQLLPLWIDTFYLPVSNISHALAADTTAVH